MPKICSMKKWLVLFLLIIGSTHAQTAKMELLSKIADEICNDITSNNVTIRSEQLLGVYMLKAVNTNKATVDKLYGADLYENEQAFEAFGEELGTYMGFKCPEVFVAFFAEYEGEQEVAINNVEGQLIKINEGQFLTFIVQEATGKKHEFLLLYDFETAYLLTDSLLKTKDKIEVSYYVTQIYDPKIGKFVNYNVVTYIQSK